MNFNIKIYNMKNELNKLKLLNIYFLYLILCYFLY